MKSFVSPIYLNINPISEEKLCVALIGVSSDEVQFSFSESKLKKASNFLSEDVYSSLKKSLRGMKREAKSAKIIMDELHYDRNKLYSSSYFNYLKEYSKGIIGFSEPKAVALDLDHDLFNKLFMMYVGEELSVDKPVETFRSRVNKYIKSEPFKRVNTNFSIKPFMVNNHIYRTHEIDFIGKNGSLYAGNSIDFGSTPLTIENKVYNFSRIVVGLKELELKSGLKPGSFELFFSNPVDKAGKSLFDRIHKDKDKNFVMKEIDELEEVGKNLEDKNYSKFSEAGLY